MMRLLPATVCGLICFEIYKFVMGSQALIDAPHRGAGIAVALLGGVLGAFAITRLVEDD